MSGRVGTKIEHAMDTGVTELELRGMGAEGCAHLATALQSEHCKVHTLDLGLNDIGAEGSNTGSTSRSIRRDSPTRARAPIGSESSPTS